MFMADIDSYNKIGKSDIIIVKYYRTSEQLNTIL